MLQLNTQIVCVPCFGEEGEYSRAPFQTGAVFDPPIFAPHHEAVRIGSKLGVFRDLGIFGVSFFKGAVDIEFAPLRNLYFENFSSGTVKEDTAVEGDGTCGAPSAESLLVKAIDHLGAPGTLTGEKSGDEQSKLSAFEGISHRAVFRVRAVFKLENGDVFDLDIGGKRHGAPGVVELAVQRDVHKVSVCRGSPFDSGDFVRGILLTVQLFHLRGDFAFDLHGFHGCTVFEGVNIFGKGQLDGDGAFGAGGEAPFIGVVFLSGEPLFEEPVHEPCDRVGGEFHDQPALVLPSHSQITAGGQHGKLKIFALDQRRISIGTGLVVGVVFPGTAEEGAGAQKDALRFGARIFKNILNDQFIRPVVVELVSLVKTDIFKDRSAGGEGDIHSVAAFDLPLFEGKVVLFKVFVFLTFGTCGASDTHFAKGISRSGTAVPVLFFVDQFLDDGAFCIKAHLKKGVFVDQFSAGQERGEQQGCRKEDFFHLYLSILIRVTRCL